MAWHAIKVGHPLWGMVATKMAAAMDRTQGDLVHVVAQLYSKDSDRIDPNSSVRQRRRLKKTDTLGQAHFHTGERLIDDAGREAANMEGVESFPHKLPPIPLFSFLDEEA
ncbi:MAG: hypothetical protein R3C68_08140 [Myxococcota bacterium]